MIDLLLITWSNAEIFYNTKIHDDVMAWKCCMHYWPFVRGIHQGNPSLTAGLSLQKGIVIKSFNIFIVVILNKVLKK